MLTCSVFVYLEKEKSDFKRLLIKVFFARKDGVKERSSNGSTTIQEREQVQGVLGLYNVEKHCNQQYILSLGPEPLDFFY